MANGSLKVRDNTGVDLSLKNLVSIIVAVAVGVWAFFGIQEKLNKNSTQLEIMNKDLVMNTEFRIKWPRGLLGSLPADSEQFMLIEELYKQTDRQQERIDNMLHNDVNIQALEKAVDKLQKDVERLKDKQRSFSNGNGNDWSSNSFNHVPKRNDDRTHSQRYNEFMLEVQEGSHEGN